VVTDPRQIKSVKKPLLPSSLRLRALPLLAVVAVLVLSILVFNQSNLYGWSRQYLIEALSMMNIGVGLDLLLMGSLLALVLMAVITDRSFRLLSFVSKLLLLPTVLGFSELAWLEYFNNGELAIIGTSLPVEVVFLNGAAQQLFGEPLAVGGSCPFCGEIPCLAGFGEGGSRLTRCPELGESFKEVPMTLKAHWPTGAPLTLTVTPIRGPDNQKAGCFILIRESANLLAHPVLAQQMATLSSILENFPMPFFMVDPFLVVTHLNEHMEKLTGYTRDEVVGRMTCGELLNTVQCFTGDCVLKQVMLHKKAFSGERRVVRTRNGREVPVTVSASIITDPEGRVIGGFEAVRDITPVVEAEQKLDLLTQLTREGLLMADENHRIIFANTRMMEILNIPRSRIIGMHLGEVLTPQHLHMAQELASLVDQGDLQQETHFCSILDKINKEAQVPRVFETCMAVSRLGEKIITCLYLRDLTSRILIERELHKTNAFFTNIIQNSVDGIVVVDIKGVPLIFNQGAERILGYTAAEMIGNAENFRRFYPVELAAEMMRRMRSDEYGPPDKLTTTRMTFINKSGEEVPVNFSATIIRERGEEVGSVGIFSDLREILKVHQELEAAQAQLVHSDKIASLGRMSAGVAHEINNPLAGILIYAELLQRDLVVDLEKAYDRVHKIRPFIIRPSRNPNQGQEYRISPRVMERYLEATRCINCFCCATACISSHKGFVGPNAVMASVVRIMDPREDATEDRLKQLYSEEGVYRCHTSKACSHVCPKEIDVAHFIGLVKEGKFN